MKKVRKKDLENLIESFYCKFIAHISKSEYYDLPYCKRATVAVMSTHIVFKYEFDDSDSQIDMENFIGNFAEEIEKITFGNLKVTYYGTEKSQYGSMIEIYIANAYEVTD